MVGHCIMLYQLFYLKGLWQIYRTDHTSWETKETSVSIVSVCRTKVSAKCCKNVSVGPQEVLLPPNIGMVLSTGSGVSILVWSVRALVMSDQLD